MQDENLSTIKVSICVAYFNYIVINNYVVILYFNFIRPHRLLQKQPFVQLLECGVSAHFLKCAERPFFALHDFTSLRTHHATVFEMWRERTLPEMC